MYKLKEADMEKVMSVEERIRRAEDIYNKRNGIYTRSSENKKNTHKKKKSVKKLLIQFIVCILIYVIFYTVTNREYVFSEEFRKSVSLFFSEKANISLLYKKSKKNILNFLNDEDIINDSEKINSIEEKGKTEENKKEEMKSEEIQNEEQKTENEQTNKTDKEDRNDENIGGATEKTENISKNNNEKLTEQQIMEKEAKEIKKSISFIRPLNRKNKFNIWMEKSIY